MRERPLEHQFGSEASSLGEWQSTIAKTRETAITTRESWKPEVATPGDQHKRGVPTADSCDLITPATTRETTKESGAGHAFVLTRTRHASTARIRVGHTAHAGAAALSQSTASGEWETSAAGRLFTRSP